MSRYIQVDFLLSGLRDSSGNSLAGGKVWTYRAGTTTEEVLYQDVEASSEHTNPIILDSRGSAEAYANGSIKFVIKDADDVTQYTWDYKEYSKLEDQSIWGGTSTGSSNTYAVSPTPALSSLGDGDIITFIANHASSGAATLNPSGLGAYSFVRADGSTALGSGDIASGGIIDARYVLSDNHFRLTSAAGVVSVSAGGTGSSTSSGARTNLGLGTIATQSAAAVTITGGTFAGSSVTTLTLQGDAAANLALKAQTGRALQVFEGTTQKLEFPSGTTAGDPVLVPSTDDHYTIGTASYAFRQVRTVGIRSKASSPISIGTESSQYFQVVDNASSPLFRIFDNGKIHFSQLDSGTTSGSITHNIPIYTEDGTGVAGYIPVYDS